MRVFEVLIVCVVLLVQLSSAVWREIVAKEYDLAYTCTGTCDEIGVLDHQPNMLERNCKVVKNCQTSSVGWTKGFVRCDYCKCQCEDNREVVPTVVKVETKKQFNEENIYGTCTGTCSRTGLVRSNYGGCKEVRDCSWAKNGWTKWFVRCDYCLCKCVNYKTASSYRLENVKYNFYESDMDVGRPVTLKRTILTNYAFGPAHMTRTVGYSTTTTTEVTTSKSLTTGLSLTVEAGGTVGVVDISTQLTTSIEAGFSTTMGSTISETKSDEIQLDINAGPRLSCEVTISGTQMNIDVPYTATLVTIFDNGSEKRENIDGIFSGVETDKVHANYHECTTLVD